MISLESWSFINRCLIFSREINHLEEQSLTLIVIDLAVIKGCYNFLLGSKLIIVIMEAPSGNQSILNSSSSSSVSNYLSDPNLFQTSSQRRIVFSSGSPPSRIRPLNQQDEKMIMPDNVIPDTLDLITSLPVELAIMIWPYLSIKELGGCSLVSTRWNMTVKEQLWELRMEKVAKDGVLRRKLCEKMHGDPDMKKWASELATIGGKEKTSTNMRLFAKLLLHTLAYYNQASEADIRIFSYSSDGRYLACTSIDNRGGMKIWDLKERRSQHGQDDHYGHVAFAKFSPDGKLLVAVCGLQSFQVWDASNEKQIKTLKAEGIPCCIAITPDNKFLAIGNSDGSLKLRDLQTFQCIQTLVAHKDMVGCLTISADGNLIASAGTDWCIPYEKTEKEICVWQLFQEKPLHIFKLTSPLISGLAISPNNKLLACCNIGGEIQIWHLETGDYLYSLGITDLGGADNLAFSPDGKFLVARSFVTNDISNSSFIKVWQLESRNCVETITFCSITKVGIGDTIVLQFINHGGSLIAYGEGVSWHWDFNRQNGKLRLRSIDRVDVPAAEWESHAEDERPFNATDFSRGEFIDEETAVESRSERISCTPERNLPFINDSRRESLELASTSSSESQTKKRKEIQLGSRVSDASVGSSQVSDDTPKADKSSSTTSQPKSTREAKRLKSKGPDFGKSVDE